VWKFGCRRGQSHVRTTYIPQMLKHNIFLRENGGAVARAVDEVGEVVLEGFRVAGVVYAFEDLDDEGGVAVGVEVDFLVVGDFADLAVEG
jgi:hypothetical protein